MSEVYGNLVGAGAYGYPNNGWRAYLSWSVTVGAASCSVYVEVGFQSVAWGFSLSSGVEASLGLTGQAGASGGGGFSSSTGSTVKKAFASKTFTVARSTSDQVLTVSGSVYNGSGYLGGTSSCSASVTVPALESWQVSYDANGGSGAPAAQTKYYGRDLVLSSVKPSWSGRTFQGWATSASGAASYAPGSTYSGNAALKLYASWKVDYTPPSISALAASRCDASGSASDSGTYLKISCSWATASGAAATRVLVQWRASGASSWETASDSSPGAASGTVSVVAGAGSVAQGTAYQCMVTVSDSGGSSSATCSVGLAFEPFDVGRQGRSVGIGSTASDTSDGLTVGFSPSQVTVGGRSLFDAMSVTRRCTVGRNSSSSASTWFKVAATKVSSAAQDRCLVLLVTQSFAGTMSLGILKASFRTDNTTGAVTSPRLSWQYLDDPYGRVSAGNWVLAYDSSSTPTVELWCREESTWYTWNFAVLEDSSRADGGWYWTLYDDYSGASGPTDGYAQLASSMYEERELSYGFKLRKRGQTVELSSENQQVAVPAASDSSWGTLSLGTVPAGWRPASWVTYNAILAVTGSDAYLLYVEAYPDGKVRIVNPCKAAYSGGVPVSATWLAGC